MTQVDFQQTILLSPGHSANRILWFLINIVIPLAALPTQPQKDSQLLIVQWRNGNFRSGKSSKTGSNPATTPAVLQMQLRSINPETIIVK